MAEKTMRKFDGKIVIVTDGGGIGGATCRRFAQPVRASPYLT
jgi:hypothetical protein